MSPSAVLETTAPSGRGEGSAQAMLVLLRKLQQSMTEMEGALSHEIENDGQLNAGDFTRLQQRKARIAVEVVDLEKAITTCAAQLGTQWKVQAQPPRLKDLARAADAQGGEAFLSLQKDLQAQALHIQRMAQKTAHNARARLQAIDATLHVIGESAKLHTTYSDAGKLAQRAMHFTSKSV